MAGVSEEGGKERTEKCEHSGLISDLSEQVKLRVRGVEVGTRDAELGGGSEARLAAAQQGGPARGAQAGVAQHETGQPPPRLPPLAPRPVAEVAREVRARLVGGTGYARAPAAARQVAEHADAAQLRRAIRRLVVQGSQLPVSFLRCESPLRMS